MGSERLQPPPYAVTASHFLLDTNQTHYASCPIDDGCWLVLRLGVLSRR